MTATPETGPAVKRYRKKPVEVDTLEWTGSNYKAIHEFTGGLVRPVTDSGNLEVWNVQEGAWIPVPPDHSVVRGQLGEYYPISPAAIAETYEPPADGEPDGSLTHTERDAVMADLGQLLNTLGLGDHARPDSPHDVMQQCIAEVARRLSEHRMRARAISLASRHLSEAP
jgi:hypothetical protein